MLWHRICLKKQNLVGLLLETLERRVLITRLDGSEKVEGSDSQMRGRKGDRRPSKLNPTAQKNIDPDTEGNLHILLCTIYAVVNYINPRHSATSQ